MDVAILLVIFTAYVICGPITNLAKFNWNVINSNRSISVPAVVPGQVHMDLYRNKIIPDPYFDDNVLQQTWIAFENWTYSTEFQVEIQKYKRHYLVMDGIDTISKISLNNEAILHTDNMHRRYVIDITRYLAQNNRLEVSFTSAISWANAQQQRHPYNVRDEVDNFGISGIHRAFIRKAQSDFGWDWGPVFVPCGIYKDIYIHSVNTGFISDVVPIIRDHGDHFTVTTNIYTYTVENVVAKVTLDLPQLQISQSVNLVTSSAMEYESSVELVVPKSKVEIWWTVGLGKQPLYNLTATLSNGGDIDTSNKRIGFRTIKIRTDVSPKNDGNLMYFEVNGIPVFSKGSNLIPFDAFESRVTDKQIEDLFKAAVYSNNNMFRIWGGGIYQRDSLYEMADEMGIMIWQEFMFACTRVPTHQSFLDTVRQEIRHQVRRLAHHASLVLWSANNENFNEYSHTDVEEVLEYSKIYTQTCYDEMARIDPMRGFLPASPSYGVSLDDRELALLKINWIQKGKQGDVHRYDYYSLCTNVNNYPKTRFASEYGYQSFPSKYTWLEQISKDNFNINSDIIKHRQHHGSGFNELNNIINFIFNLPNNNNNNTDYFIKYIYLSQAIQSVCMSTQAEYYRRAMSDPEAYCMGSLYWQLNDIWAGITWASIEYNGRWKLLHYASKRFYSEVLISPYDDTNGHMNIYIISDRISESRGTLSVRVYDWDGGMVGGKEMEIDIPKYNSSLVYSEVWDVALYGRSKDTAFVMVTVNDSTTHETLSTNWMYPNNNYGGFKSINLHKSTLIADRYVQLDEYRIQFTLSVDYPSPFVYLQTSIKGYFSDNGMVIVPLEPMIMVFNSVDKVTIDELKSTMEMSSLVDAYN